jgi:hypothetical protein
MVKRRKNIREKGAAIFSLSTLSLFFLKGSIELVNFVLWLLELVIKFNTCV